MRYLLFNIFIIAREISSLYLEISQNNGITIIGWIFTRQSKELFPKLLLSWVENRSSNNKNINNNIIYKINSESSKLYKMWLLCKKAHMNLFQKK